MIDTISISAKIPSEKINEALDLLKNISHIIKDHSYISITGSLSICIRPDKDFTVPLREIYNYVSYIQKSLGIEFTLNRIDFATDLALSIQNNKQLFGLFLSCLNYIKMQKIVPLHIFSKGSTKKNLKLNHREWQLTFYSHSDHTRRYGSTRLEYRATNIRIKANKLNYMKKILYAYTVDINQIINVLPLVEHLIVKDLYEEWKPFSLKYPDISDYIKYLDIEGRIYTRNILAHLLNRAGYLGKVESFIKNYRKTRKDALKFISKTELNKLINLVKHEYKMTIK